MGNETFSQSTETTPGSGGNSGPNIELEGLHPDDLTSNTEALSPALEYQDPEKLNQAINERVAEAIFLNVNGDPEGRREEIINNELPALHIQRRVLESRVQAARPRPQETLLMDTTETSLKYEVRYGAVRRVGAAVLAFSLVPSLGIGALDANRLLAANKVNEPRTVEYKPVDLEAYQLPGYGGRTQPKTQESRQKQPKNKTQSKESPGQASAKEKPEKQKEKEKINPNDPRAAAQKMLDVLEPGQINRGSPNDRVYQSILQVAETGRAPVEDLDSGETVRPGANLFRMLKDLKVEGGFDYIITSMTTGETHDKEGLHPKGMAVDIANFDIHGNNIAPDMMRWLNKNKDKYGGVNELFSSLYDEYNLNEGEEYGYIDKHRTHIHVGLNPEFIVAEELELGWNQELNQVMRKFGRKQGIPQSTLAAMCVIETFCGKHVEESGAGARGLTQFIGSTFQGMQRKYPRFRGLNFHELHDKGNWNKMIDMSAQYMADERKAARQAFGENLKLDDQEQLVYDLIAYNAGERRAIGWLRTKDAHQLPLETRRYVAFVSKIINKGELGLQEAQNIWEKTRKQHTTKHLEQIHKFLEHPLS